MENVKISSKNAVFHGSIVNLPIDGEVLIEKDGSLIVSKECCEILKGHPDFQIEIEEEQSENQLSKESLEKLTIKDLLVILEDSGVDKSSYSKFISKKSLLINFIIKTLE